MSNQESKPRKLKLADNEPLTDEATKKNAPFDFGNTPVWEIDNDFINPNQELPPLQTWCVMGERQAIPKQGIITFSAKQKKGKSTATYALAIPLLSGKVFDTITPTDERPNCIMVFDMEMSTTTLCNRIKRQMENIGSNGNKFIVCSLKAKPINERIATISAKIEQYNPDIVVIDQVAKLARDINSPTEANEVVEQLEQWGTNRSVWAIMHQNKSDDDTNMRGHLGSQLSYAAVEAYNVDRKEGIFIVTPTEARETDTDNATPTHFAMSSEGRIIDANDIIAQKQAEEINLLRHEFAMYFGIDSTLTRTEIKGRIMEKDNISARSAEDKISQARNYGIIRKTSNNQKSPYQFVP